MKRIKTIAFWIYQTIGLLNIFISSIIAWMIISRLSGNIIIGYERSGEAIFKDSHLICRDIFFRALILGLFPVANIFGKSSRKFKKTNWIPFSPSLYGRFGNKKNFVIRFFVMHSCRANLYLFACFWTTYSDWKVYQAATGDLHGYYDTSSAYLFWFFMIFVFHILLDMYICRKISNRRVS